jgi:prepilin-type N-terminal cleavage/methylation domain-containing protein
MKNAFTMLELVFVIVVIGVLSKFGVELMGTAYENYLYTKINNKLQNQSGTAVEFIAKRLSHRVNDSVIGKKADNTFVGIQSINPNEDYRVLEWVSRDIDGWRGHTQPYWSGIADLNASSNSHISTPNTDMSDIEELVETLSHGKDISNVDSYPAIYFIGSNSDIQNGYGWDGSFPSTLTSRSIHPISVSADNNLNGSFAGVDLYEYYQLAWTANAISIENYNAQNETYDLVFYYDYQPWLGEIFSDGKKSIIMQNVPTFQFLAVGSMIKIQVCVKSNLINNEQGHAICKEKTVF